MGPGELQIGFEFHHSGPLCASCGVRGAKPYPGIPGAFYKLCTRCLRDRQKYGRSQVDWSPCPWCHKPHEQWDASRGSHTTCSKACANAYRRDRVTRYKAEVFRLLGNHCRCEGCGWHGGGHGGRCEVTDPNVLEVDHTHGNGGIVRTTRKDWSRSRPQGGPWLRYLREIRANPTGHGLQLLCANCHRWITHARREKV